MSDEFVITSAITDNPRFLACSGLARLLYYSMILKADHEGRALADPLTWASKAALFGAAEVPMQEVADAMAELDSVRLAPRYVVDGKQYLFLPGRFEHNRKRTHWRKSVVPLPPEDMLAEFPEYTAGLRRLTTKAELRNSLRNNENWRYPQLAQQIQESGGQQQGNSRATVGRFRTGVEVEVEVDVDNEKEVGGSTALEESTSASPRTAGLPHSRNLASENQEKRLREMCAERDLQLSDVCAELGIEYPVRWINVTAVMEYIKKQPRRSVADPVAERRRQEVDAAWSEIGNLLSDPAAAVEKINTIQDERIRFAVMNRVDARLRELAAAVDRSLDSVLFAIRGDEELPVRPLAVHDLPDVIRALGLEVSH